MSPHTPPIPDLKGDALDAVEYRRGHLQIIASAGAGKTDVVAQRVARLLAEKEDLASIVALTLTEKAAASLKARIDRRAVALTGQDVRNTIGKMYVGTIHAYCLQLLQEHVPRFEVYDVLDDHRLTAFLSREAYRIGINTGAQARRLVSRYIDDSLHLGDSIVSGRADIIFDASGGEERLAIVDSKTAADEHDRHGFQLCVYTDAARREGLSVDRAFVHDLRNAERHEIDVHDEAVADADTETRKLLEQMRSRDFQPRPGKPCTRCDVRLLCTHGVEA